MLRTECPLGIIPFVGFLTFVHIKALIRVLVSKFNTIKTKQFYLLKLCNGPEILPKT